MNKKAAKSEVPSNLLFENGRMVDFHIGNEHLCCLVAHFLYENGRMVDFQTRREHLCCLVANFFFENWRMVDFQIRNERQSRNARQHLRRSDFIYTRNAARPRSDFIYTKSAALARSMFENLFRQMCSFNGMCYVVSQLLLVSACH